MLRYFPAPQGLGDEIGVGYSLRVGAEPAALPMPAMVGQLQVVMAGGWRRAARDGAQAPATRVGLVGPAGEASRLVVEPGTWAIGIGLPPAGWRRVVRTPADLLLDRTVEAQAIWGDAPVRRLLADLDPSMSDERAMAALTAFVLGRHLSGPEVDRRLPILDRWVASAGDRTLDGLAAELGASHRQAARLTGALFGLSPKPLELKYRTLRAAALIGLGHGSASDGWASADAFYDQSHLIRNFQRFIGFTPQAFRRERGAFARAMLAGRWRAGARSAVTLWS